MRICGATLVGPDRGKEADEAYESVKGLVDDWVTYSPGVITDFSDARNYLLQRCMERATSKGEHFDWALMIDTDERLILRQTIDQIKWALSVTTTDVIMVPHESGTYEKERIFRLPVKGHYRGRTHEAWITDPGAIRATWSTSLAFSETEKSPDQITAKLERDVALLTEEIAEKPEDPRWWYYLGDTQYNRGRWSEAMAAFTHCWGLAGWDEESAWAAYRTATIYAEQEKYQLAVVWCANGLVRHSGMSELPWLAGWCCYKMGEYRKAIWWEQMARALNEEGAHSARIGFRHPPALAEGPWDVMRWAYGELGQAGGKEWAEEGFRQATHPVPR